MSLEEQFDALTLEALQNFVRSGQEENLSLDFKTANTPDLSHAADRKNLAKALSGFANSSGGLLIWGIVATRNADQIDCASDFREINPLRLFLTRLNTLTGEAVSPMIDGVRHKTLEANADSGFAVTLVPESESGPHMAKCREDRHYKRSGDSFYRMEHYDLEDMFGRRRRPKLELTTRLERGGPATEIVLGIRNIGRGTARAPYLAFSVTEPFRPAEYGLDGNGNNGLSKLHYGQGLRYRYGSTGGLVIHPGTIHEVTRVKLPGFNPRPEMLPNRDIIIDYEISAEDTRIFQDSIILGRVAPE